MAKLHLTQEILDKFHHYRDFLKKSEKYKRINELLLERSKQYPVTNPLVNSWCYVAEELKTPYYDWLSYATSVEEREVLYQEDQSNKTILNIVYPLFQDVNNDKQIELLEHRVKLFYELYDLSPISRASFSIPVSIFSEFGQHRDQKQFTKEEAIEELNEAIFKLAVSNRNDHSFEINPLLPDSYLVNQFKHYLKTIRDRDKDTIQGIRTMFLSSKEHTEGYLDALLKLLSRLEAKGDCWDEKNQKKFLEEIYLETHPNLTEIPSGDSNWRRLRRQRNHAFELIEKAENALFPGPSTAPKKMKGVITTNEYKKITPLLRVRHTKPFSENNLDLPTITDCWPFWT